MNIGDIFNLEQLSAPESSSVRLIHDFHTGIELEVEGCEVGSNFGQWAAISDNSLRNSGREFVTRGPLAGRDLQLAVEELSSEMANVSYTLSERCSTHIHINVRDLTPVQLTNYLCYLTMVEPLLFKAFGNQRQANIFCTPTDMGTDNYRNIVQLAIEPTRDTLRSMSWSKYAAVGLFRLPDLGTVELRMFTPIVEADQLYRVINLLHSLKYEAMAMESPNAIIMRKIEQQASGLVSQYFPELAEQAYESVFERGVRVLNDILITAETVKTTERLSAKYRAARDLAQQHIDRLSTGI